MKMIIEGGHELSNTVKISGAKNSAVALIPAALLADGIVTIDNVPRISDIDALVEILRYLNAEVTFTGNKIVIDSRNIVNREIPNNISKKLRASYYFMAALLGKFHKVDMFFPGGCSIGSRPIDQTLKGFKALGAKIKVKDGKYSIYTDDLKGSRIYLDMPSIGATINIMLAAVKAKGVTIIENAAKEPEISNVAVFLNQLGANIKGAGTSKIKITGTPNLKGGYTEVIPDRIEAGTYIIMGVLLGNNLRIENIIPEHINSLLDKLKEMKANIVVGKDYVIANKTDNLLPVKIKTLGYPGFPTDLQQPLTALLTSCDGMSLIEENIYENRFQNVSYLNKMKADIKIDGKKIYINGKTPLVGSRVKATDLRAGACLIIAGLIASGETEISNIEYVLRGYEDIVLKLTNIGAKVKIT